MKKILALVAGVAIIGSTATACSQINGDASNASKAVIATLFGVTTDANNCDSLVGTAQDSATDNEMVIFDAEGCKAVYEQTKEFKFEIKFGNTFVAKDNADIYNVGVVIKTVNKDEEEATWDAFVLFNKEGNKDYSKITKVTISKR